MRTPLVLAIAISTLAAAPAFARPLPKGMKVVVVGDRPMVKQGALTVQLFDDDRLGHGTKIKAKLSADGATVQVSWAGCMDVEQDDVPLAHVTARLENLAGMRLQLTKKYAAAIPHFAAAVAAAPDEAVYATNLLSAQAMAGKLDDADRTLATYGPRNPARFVWRLAVDSDLKTVNRRPAALALAAAAPGAARIKDLTADVAFSALGGGLVAMLSNAGNGGPDSPVGQDLIIVDVTAGRELLRLPVAKMEDVCADAADAADAGDPCDGGDDMLPRCTKKQLAATAAHLKDADALLAALGFTVAPKAMVEIPLDDTATTVTSPDGKTKIAVTGDALAITRGGKSFTVGREQRIDNVVFVGDQVLLEYSETHLEYCDDDSFHTSLELARPAAK